MSKAIQTADLTWQCIDGIEIPVSTQYGDLYFSQDNGLLESRHVYLAGNDLAERLSQLTDFQYFSVGEIGFGTGLNVLTLWQLWQSRRPDNYSHLHVISFEKHPLKKSDLIRALKAWPELKPLADQLIQHYPAPISGGHRIHFEHERFSLDLWFGDATESLQQLPQSKAINAWFLDGFTPALNPELWQDALLAQLLRLSDVGTTFASFSVAGHLRRALIQLGVELTCPTGFGHKKQMLKAILNVAQPLNEKLNTPNVALLKSTDPLRKHNKQRQIAIIGAGVAGLSSAYAMAQRGHLVTVYDQFEALSGASGNPLALLNPRLNPIEKIDDHLMSVSWKFALSHYPKFKAYQAVAVNQYVLKNPKESLQLAQEYPQGIYDYKSVAQVQADQQLHVEFDALCFESAGTVVPQLFKDQVLAHPLIQFKKIGIDRIQEQPSSIQLYAHDQIIDSADQVIVCCALNSPNFFDYYPALKPNRGQVSWMNNVESAFDPKLAHSYGGYCVQIDPQNLLLGASFFPNRADDEVETADHQHNFELFKLVFPEHAQKLPAMAKWQGRASVRAQSLDYFPLVGQLDPASQVYTMSGLGSKGYLYAPLCAEILASQILNEVCPVSSDILKKINPRRFMKKVKPKKPYYQKPTQD